MKRHPLWRRGQSPIAQPILLYTEESKFSFWTGFGVMSAFCTLALAGLVYYQSTQKLPTPVSVHPEAEAIPAAVEISAPVGSSSKKIAMDSLRWTQGSGEFTLVVYTDLECRYCKKFHHVVQKVLPNYPQIRLSYKHAPLPLHDRAVTEAVAAECAGAQGKFFEYIDRIFAITPSDNQLERGRLFAAADKLELDLDAFNACMNQPTEYIATITSDATEARLTGSNGVPYAIVVNKNGKIIKRIQGSVSRKQLRRLLKQTTNHESTPAN